MKEQLKEFILQKLGGKLPDDPCQDTIKVCGIKVSNADSFDKEFHIIDKYVANSLSVGVFYSAHQAQVELSINGNLTDGYGSFALSISKLDDGIESLVKLMRSGAIQLTGYPASEHPQFNEEDKVDHRTVALLASKNKKWLLSINLKHRMLTLPIGKVHPNESLIDGLCREMWEELGIKLDDVVVGSIKSFSPTVTFTKKYDFDGTPVNVTTNVFEIDAIDCFSDAVFTQCRNMEPEKCGGLMWVDPTDIPNIVDATGLLLADCLDAAMRLHLDPVQVRTWSIHTKREDNGTT